MNRFLRHLIPFALVGALAACAPAADEPIATSAETSQPMASPSSSSSISPMPSHDMGDMAGSGETETVEIVNFAYARPDLVIGAGTEVTFTNLDSAPHTVTAGSDKEPMTDVFDSGLLEQGESFTFTFDEPGTYAYFCDRHPPMQASITVEE